MIGALRPSRLGESDVEKTLSQHHPCIVVVVVDQLTYALVPYLIYAPLS